MKRYSIEVNYHKCLGVTGNVSQVWGKKLTSELENEPKISTL